MWAVVVALFFLYWKWMAIYIAGGVVYSVLKWFLLLIKLRRKVNDLKEMTVADLRIARNNIARQIFGQYEYPPTAKNNKGNFLIWSIFWPLNALWTAIADVAKEAWLWIYRTIASMLDAMAKKILPA